MSSFLMGGAKTLGPLGKIDPLTKKLVDAVKPTNPPGLPPVPNPADAQNAALQQTDLMRQRRGMLANIYAGSQSAQPVTGKTTLGS
jgi:hypothetical protein